MKAALVVDWLDKYAGSERVIKEIDDVFLFSEYHSMVNIMSDQDQKKMFNGKAVLVQDTLLRLSGRFFRYFFFLFPFFIKKVRVGKDVDLIISSSHAVAKSVRSKNSIHISYFQARNMKYIWEESDLYFSGFKKFFKFYLPYLRRFDLLSSQSPDYIVSNSRYVQSWVKHVYGRDSVVIYPPVDTDFFKLVSHKEDFFVTVGRLEKYKRFDVVIEAFSALGKKLIVIGDGSERSRLQSLAKPNVIFTGFLSASDVNDYISRARAFVYAGIEDFGIAPVEAQSCGTPVVCLNVAGTAETVVDGFTGVYFQEQSVSALIRAIDKLEENYVLFDPVKIREHAETFSTERFRKQFYEFVTEKYSQHQEKG